MRPVFLDRQQTPVFYLYEKSYNFAVKNTKLC
jgi:hypothetical protein